MCSLLHNTTSCSHVSLRLVKMEDQSTKTFNYTKAIVCGVPSSLPALAQRQSDAFGAVDYSEAVRQHAKYVATLKHLGLQLIELPADENHPDCVFVEDVAVVCEGVALLAYLGHPSRRGESAKMRKVFDDLGLTVHEMEQPATLDGGDVLFTGKEFLVGLSTRTNHQGLDSLAKAFPKYPVTGITVKDNLHLKCMMTMVGPDLIVVGGSEASKNAWNDIESKARFKYKRLVVNEDKAANCLYINGTVVHLPAVEIPSSYDAFKQLPCEKIELENSELFKVDGCLTCLSILL